MKPPSRREMDRIIKKALRKLKRESGYGVKKTFVGNSNKALAYTSQKESEIGKRGNNHN